MQQDFIRHFLWVFAIKTTHFDYVLLVKHSQRTLGVKNKPMLHCAGASCSKLVPFKIYNLFSSRSPLVQDKMTYFHKFDFINFVTERQIVR